MGTQGATAASRVKQGPAGSLLRTCRRVMLRMVRHFDGLTVINAGSLLRHHEPGFAVLDLDAREVVFHGFGPTGVVEVERCSLEQAP